MTPEVPPIPSYVGHALSIEPDLPYKAPARPQLHFSSLDTLWTCGEKFFRIYVSGERQDTNANLIVGISVDTSVSRNMEAKMITGQLLPLEEAKAIARDTVLAEWELRTVVLDREERLIGEAAVKAEAIDKAVRLASLHAREAAPHINPTHVQRRWAIEIPGLPFDLVGAVDLQEGALAGRDTKTSGKTPVSNIADMSDQLTMYSLAIMVLDGVAPAEMVLDYLIDNQLPVYRQFRSTRDADDYRVLMNRVENAAEVIAKGAFTPAQPTDWHCSLDYCSFARTCKYFKRPKSMVIQPGGKIGSETKRDKPAAPQRLL